MSVVGVKTDPIVEAKAWNVAHPVGTTVDFWCGVREGAPSGRGATNGRAMVLGGHTAVVWVTGCRGAVALSHVEPVVDAGVGCG